MAAAQNSLVILKNVLKQTCSPSLEIRQEIRSETGLSVETIKSWFIKQNDESLSVPQQEILKTYLRKTSFVTKESSTRIAEETSLRAKTVLRWFIRQGCPFIRDDHVQLLQASFDHFPFLTKATTIRLSKETKLAPKIICRWFMEEYKTFDNELELLIKLNSESKQSRVIAQKQSRVIAQGGVSKVAMKNKQRLTPNNSQRYPERSVTNCEGIKQARSACQNSFRIQKLQNLQNLLMKTGHFKRLSK